MKPLNRAERNNAFLSFLLLFIITIGIVIAVVFFSIEVKFIENERLRNEVINMQKEKILSDSFRNAMDITLNELKKFDLNPSAKVMTHRDVELKIQRMGRFIKYIPDGSSGEEKSFYELVMQSLAELNDAKLKISDLEGPKK